jgi:hypothetical protein
VSPTDWKTIAWNGVRFAVPGDWEPGQIGRRHLLFESEPGPVMEIKWGAVKGRFSRPRQLRELSRRIGRKRSAFQERSLSGEWRTSLSGFEAAGFQWDAENERAMGVLLYCAACRTASLIQFFDRPGTASIERNAARVLSSFRDHGTDNRVAWALYDIVAFLPDYFTLERHRLEAGRFVLEFKGRRCRLTLFRWAPAEVLLQKQRLSEFAETFAGGAGLEFRLLTIAGDPGVDGRDAAPTGFLACWKTWLGLSSFRRLRLWHVAGRNRILGVRVEGRRPIDDLEMCALSDGYGMDDEKARATLADPG